MGKIGWLVFCLIFFVPIVVGNPLVPIGVGVIGTTISTDSNVRVFGHYSIEPLNQTFLSVTTATLQPMFWGDDPLVVSLTAKANYANIREFSVEYTVENVSVWERRIASVPSEVHVILILLPNVTVSQIVTVRATIWGISSFWLGGCWVVYGIFLFLGLFVAGEADEWWDNDGKWRLRRRRERKEQQREAKEQLPKLEKHVVALVAANEDLERKNRDLQVKLKYVSHERESAVSAIAERDRFFHENESLRTKLKAVRFCPSCGASLETDDEAEWEADPSQMTSLEEMERKSLRKPKPLKPSEVR